MCVDSRISRIKGVTSLASACHMCKKPPRRGRPIQNPLPESVFSTAAKSSCTSLTKASDWPEQSAQSALRARPSSRYGMISDACTSCLPPQTEAFASDMMMSVGKDMPTMSSSQDCPPSQEAARLRRVLPYAAHEFVSRRDAPAMARASEVPQGEWVQERTAILTHASWDHQLFYKHHGRPGVPTRAPQCHTQIEVAGDVASDVMMLVGMKDGKGIPIMSPPQDCPGAQLPLHAVPAQEEVFGGAVSAHRKAKLDLLCSALQPCDHAHDLLHRVVSRLGIPSAALPAPPPPPPPPPQPPSKGTSH